MHIGTVLHYINFKVEFSRLTLLMGNNGAGKSNVFCLIAAIRDLIQGANGALEMEL